MRHTFGTGLLFAILSALSFGQADATPTADDGKVAGSVPHIIRFSSTLKDASGQMRAGNYTAVFAFYAEQGSAAPLWQETQNITADEQGRYSVVIGGASAQGLPPELFAGSEARWLEVKIAGETTGQRMLLVSVPYALKAAEAERLNGLSASDFVRAEDVSRIVASAVRASRTDSRQAKSAPQPLNTVQGTTANGATSFTDSSAFEVVLVTQNGTGTALHATSAGGNAVQASSPGTGTNGAAIYGKATSIAATSVGTQGDSPAPTGIGVYGHATSATGLNVGVRGETASTGGKGVLGLASASTGSTIAVHGSASSATGIGVEGQATGASGGTGVYGVAQGISGSTVGVSGEIFSPAGIAGQFISNNAGGKLIVGKGAGGATKFTVDAAGNVTASGNLNVSGSFSAGSLTLPTATFSNSNTTQVLNVQQTGTGAAVAGVNVGTAGVGVLGRALNSGGAGFGIKGESASITGVAGAFDNTAGGKILSGLNSGVEKFSVDGAGNITGAVLNGTSAIVRGGATIGSALPPATTLQVDNGAVSLTNLTSPIWFQTQNFGDVTLGHHMAIGSVQDTSTEEALVVYHRNSPATNDLIGADPGIRMQWDGQLFASILNSTGAVNAATGNFTSTDNVAPVLSLFANITPGAAAPLISGSGPFLGCEFAPCSGVQFSVDNQGNIATNGKVSIGCQGCATTTKLQVSSGSMFFNSFNTGTWYKTQHLGTVADHNMILASNQDITQQESLAIYHFNGTPQDFIPTTGTLKVARFEWDGAVFASVFNTAGLDLAEKYPSEERHPLEPGDVVAIAKTGGSSLVRTSRAYDDRLMGVVSEKPGITLGGSGEQTASTDGTPLALNGRVRVKVSLENGPIHAGDFLTSSSTPGVAMRAGKTGRVIGMALDDFNPNGSEHPGMVMVFVNPHQRVDAAEFAQMQASLAKLTLQVAALRRPTVKKKARAAKR